MICSAQSPVTQIVGAVDEHHDGKFRSSMLCMAGTQ